MLKVCKNDNKNIFGKSQNLNLFLHDSLELLPHELFLFVVGANVSAPPRHNLPGFQCCPANKYFSRAKYSISN